MKGELTSGGFEQPVALATAAETAVGRVGDGCVVFQLAPSETALHAVAAEHRDPDGRRRLRALLEDPPLSPPDGQWLRQSISSGRALRLPTLAPDSLAAAGLPAAESIADVVLCPISAAEAVMVMVRDGLGSTYRASDRAELGAIAATATRSARRAGADRDLSPTSIVAGPLPDLIDATSAAILVTDRERTSTFVNQAACELVGCTADRIIGASIEEFVEVPDQAAWADFAAVEGTDCRLLRADGSKGWVSISMTPRLDACGQRESTVHTLVDVSERHDREVEQRTRLDLERNLARFAEEVLREPPSPGAAERAVRMLVEQFGAPLVALAGVSRDRREARILVSAGELSERDPNRWVGRFAIPPDSATHAALEVGEAVRVAEFGDATGYRRGPIARAAAAGSVACAPVADGAACIGVLRCEPDAISDQELRMLDSVGRMLGAAWPPR